MHSWKKISEGEWVKCDDQETPTKFWKKKKFDEGEAEGLLPLPLLEKGKSGGVAKVYPGRKGEKEDEGFKTAPAMLGG